VSSEVEAEESALYALESALGRFQKEAEETLAAVQQEVSRTERWLRGRHDYWQRERDQARQAVDQAREDLRGAEAALSACLAWRDDEGRGRSCSGEAAAVRAAEYELRQAEERLCAAEAELQNVKQWMAKLEQAVGEHAPHSDHLTQVVGSTIGEARAFLDDKIGDLARYRDELRAKIGQAVTELVAGKQQEVAAGIRENRPAVSLLDSHSFEAELRRRFPGEATGRIREIHGFFDERDGRAFAREGREYLLAPVHERLHQISKPMEGALPRSLTEGITEWYARRDLGPYSHLHRISQDSRGNVVIEDPIAYYDREVRIVAMLNALVGERLVGGAYFHGQVDELRIAVDAELGSGRFGEVLSLMEEGRYGRAEALILKHYRPKK
jgi:hypothetical protein